MESLLNDVETRRIFRARVRENALQKFYIAVKLHRRSIQDCASEAFEMFADKIIQDHIQRMQNNTGIDPDLVRKLFHK